ncbi:hypothetical protein KVT40_002423 [Elsinoe batatas]|uniref:Endonuclease/exonuclease/phosphatase domain-containing protein n=1 Tax=Elsinoe batatas TaxID=2601811 RepID=A0A8K0L957_9PEZI|nr:hypothetical protein KVT40_002423 [Elsinoe batatas]
MPRPISPPPLKRRRLSPPTAPPSPDTLRIFAWNINGIGPFLPPAQKPITTFFSSTTTSPSPTSGPPKHSLRAFLARHNWPHLLLLQEVHISPTDHATQSAVRRAANPSPPSSSPSLPDPGPTYETHFTLPLHLPNARSSSTPPRRAHHGVLTLIRTDFLHSQKCTLSSPAWDHEGRFSITTTSGIDGWPRLSIWNVYALNGTDYPFRDPVTGEVKGTRHERKREVHALLQEEVRRLEAQGVQVVLAGDMNIARDVRDGWPNLRTRPMEHVVNREDFVGRFFEEGGGKEGLGMMDTFREVNGEEARGYSYRPRGVKWGSSCDRVDYVMVSKGLRGRVREAGILESGQERGPSDHVPVFATLEFGGGVKDGGEGVRTEDSKGHSGGKREADSGREDRSHGSQNDREETQSQGQDGTSRKRSRFSNGVS